MSGYFAMPGQASVYFSTSVEPDQIAGRCLVMCQLHNVYS